MRILGNLDNYLLFNDGHLTKQNWQAESWQVVVTDTNTEHAAYMVQVTASSSEPSAGVGASSDVAMPMFTVIVDGQQRLEVDWILRGHFIFHWIFKAGGKNRDDVVDSCDVITVASGSSVTVLHEQQIGLNWQRDVHIAEGSRLIWYSWIANNAVLDRLDLCMDACDSLFVANIGQLFDDPGMIAKRDWRIIHQAPRTQSQFKVKTVLAGGAQVDEHCLVVMQPLGVAAETQVYNHALLLDDRSKMQASPELEVYCEEVNCRHGATSGHLDGASLFYLTSRGIDRSAATSLMISGFLAEVAAPWHAQQLPLLDMSQTERLEQ